MATPRHQADIAKTYENYRFLLILGGWRLGNAVSGSLWKLGGLLAGLLGVWMAAGWLAGGLFGAGWLACRPQGLQDLRVQGPEVVSHWFLGAQTHQFHIEPVTITTRLGTRTRTRTRTRD